MGRPLSKKYIGNPDLSGYQLVLSFVWLADSTEPEEGFYIVRQAGTRKFVVSNGERTGVIFLVDAMPTEAGQGVVIVETEEGEEYARTIYNRTVKTYDDNRYTWNINGTGQAKLPFEAYVSPAEKIELIQGVADAGGGEAVVDYLKEQGLKLMTSETKDALETIPVDSGRAAAVGDGIAEWIELYGEPDFETLKAWIILHVKTEKTKLDVVGKIDSAKTEKTFGEALKGVSVLSADREEMIAGLIASEIEAAVARGEELKEEDYTVVSKAFAVKVAAGEDISAIVTKTFVARNALTDKKFYGVLPLIEALKAAMEPEAPVEPEPPVTPPTGE